MRRFWKGRRQTALEDGLRASPEPRADFLEGLVRRTATPRARRRGPAALAASLSVAILLGLGVTGGLAASGSSIGNAASAVKHVFVASDKDKSQKSVKSNDTQSAKPARDQYTRPGKGCGDKNHEHTGPPGQNKKGGDVKPCPAPSQH